MEKALQSAIVGSYIQGVSTRRVKEIVEALNAKALSPTTVSNMAKELDERVELFQEEDNRGRNTVLICRCYVLQDSRREWGNYVNKALFVVAGTRKDRRKEILGIRVVDTESEGFWREFFEDLKLRGLRGVELVVSDGHKGIDR